MLPNFLQRHRRVHDDGANRDNVQDSNDIESQQSGVLDDDEARRRGVVSDRALLVMAQNHMVAFVLTMYAIYLVCRLLGWKPGSKSTTYTLYFGNDSVFV